MRRVVRGEPRPGFTVLELLVVVTVVGLLLALILPAVQMSREAARRGACGANLRQVGLAATNYAATHQVFPAGGSLGWSVHTALLPYLGEQTIADAIPTHDPPMSFGLGGITRVNPDDIPAPPAVLRCPSDAANDGGAVNFAGSGGRDGTDGLFQNVGRGGGRGDPGAPKRRRPAAVRDGLANTVAFAEVPAYAPGHGRGHRTGPRDETFPPEDLLAACDRLAAADPVADTGFGFGRPWAGLMRLYGVTLFNHLAPPNRPGCTNDGTVATGTYPAGGAHRGGGERRRRRRVRPVRRRRRGRGPLAGRRHHRRRRTCQPARLNPPPNSRLPVPAFPFPPVESETHAFPLLRPRRRPAAARRRRPPGGAILL